MTAGRKSISDVFEKELAYNQHTVGCFYSEIKDTELLGVNSTNRRYFLAYSASDKSLNAQHGDIFDNGYVYIMCIQEENSDNNPTLAVVLHVIIKLEYLIQEWSATISESVNSEGSYPSL